MPREDDGLQPPLGRPGRLLQQILVGQPRGVVAGVEAVVAQLVDEDVGLVGFPLAVAVDVEAEGGGRLDAVLAKVIDGVELRAGGLEVGGFVVEGNGPDNAADVIGGEGGGRAADLEVAEGHHLGGAFGQVEPAVLHPAGRLPGQRRADRDAGRQGEFVALVADGAAGLAVHRVGTGEGFAEVDFQFVAGLGAGHAELDGAEGGLAEVEEPDAVVALHRMDRRFRGGDDRAALEGVGRGGEEEEAEQSEKHRDGSGSASQAMTRRGRFVACESAIPPEIGMPGESRGGLDFRLCRPGGIRLHPPARGDPPREDPRCRRLSSVGRAVDL